MLQIDIETDVTDWYCTRRLISIQFGSCKGSRQERQQWFLQWSELNESEKQLIKQVLEDQHVLKLAHNGAYEYIILRFYDIIIENMYDTMLAEKILHGGLENVNYALADISWKYLKIMMDKSEQKNFGDNIITDSKIRYGITDVAYLDIIRKQQMMEATVKGLINVFALEMDALLAFSDITYEGIELDKEKWRENERMAKPLVEEALGKLNKWLRQEPLYTYALKKEYLSNADRITINFNAPAQKAELLRLIFPDIAGAGLPVIKKYIRDHSLEGMDMEKLNILVGLQNKDYSPFEKYLVKYHRDYLEQEEYLIPAGRITINWNSQPQVLPLFQLVIPKLNSLAEEERNKHAHQILKDYEDYTSATKLITTYGEEFIVKHVNPDGRVRTNFNQVVSTGRVSSSKPNMQNIPAKESVGTRYRNAFVCGPDEVFVDSDYASQELVLIAYVSKDPVWLEALANGWDLHSICADLVHKKKWKDAAENDCAYYKVVVNEKGVLVQQKQKCKCKGHKHLRDGIKSINFGLAYGMSEIKLSGELSITVREAMNLIEEYFRTFPAIKRTLDFLGAFGVTQGYIQTLAPFFRKRWFPHWNLYLPWIDAHIEGIKYIPALGEIERASKNMPIQGSAADMMKTAMVLVRSYIRDNGLRDTVRMVAQVHDQLTTVTKRDIAEEWKPILDQLMCEAGRLIVPTDLLKADTNITEVWTK